MANHTLDTDVVVPTADGHPRRPSVSIATPFLSAASLQPPLPTPPRTADNGEILDGIPHHLYKRLPKHALKSDGTPDYLRLMLTSRVYDLIQPTPLTPAVSLSARLGCTILLKREDLQPVFSFKIRGAYNLMASLTEEERWRGVIACSAGNHAQGVALAGNKLGIACTIVMPLNTPSIKWVNVERLGAKVVLHGADFDEAKRECSRLAEFHGLTNIPPFDEPYIIAGQGTTAVEILRQTDPNNLDGLFVSVGGGGFLAGCAAYVKAVAPPTTKVIGVETHDADAMTRSIQTGSRVTLDEVGLFSDGTAVRVVGEETFRVCREYADDFISTSNDEICAAIKDVFEDTRSVPEPAGALSVAGMKKYIQDNSLVGSGKTFVAVVSGANVNFDRLRFVAERAELGEQREALLSVIIPEEPGAFMKLINHLMPRAITEFSYRYSSSSRAYIICSFYLSAGASPGAGPAVPPVVNGLGGPPALSAQGARKQELLQIITALGADGMKARDLSDNEMAKAHARYLVGGRKKVPNERLFRFEFPERPGALKRFLQTLRSDWNISLFHYRNYGGDLGKILAAIQVSPSESADFDAFLKQLGYSYVEETDNEVYHDFLTETEPPFPGL